MQPPVHRIWFRNPLAVLADAPADGGVVVEGTVISEVLAAGEEPAGPVEETIDASESVLLPGLINTHHHYYQTLTRACPWALDKALFPWLKSLYPIWAGLDLEMVEMATELACAELLLSGCTTSADHHYLFPPAAASAIDVQVETLRRIGQRAVLTRGSMSLGEDQGGLPPASVVQDRDEILADSARLVDRYHDPAPGSMLQVALAPCSPFSVSRELMVETAALARDRGVRLHTHLAETEDENAFCERSYGMRPLDYLESVEWLADDVWLAHGIHFDDREMGMLGEAGVGVTHCPSSNMLLGSGQCRTLELERAGCRLGLGVDGSASNDGSNMVQEVRQAFLLQRLRYGAASVSHLDALRWATTGSAGCLGRTDIGAIAPGMQADLALFRPDEPNFSGAGDPLAALVLCGARKAHDVMVAGNWRVRAGEIPGLDLAELQVRHGALARRLQGIG